MSDDVPYDAEAVIEQIGAEAATLIVERAKLQSALVVSLKAHQRTREELAKIRGEFSTEPSTDGA